MALADSITKTPLKDAAAALNFLRLSILEGTRICVLSFSL